MNKCVRFVLSISISLILPLGCAPMTEDDEFYVEETHKITNNFINEMRREFNLFCIGTGGNLNKGVQEVDVSFIIYRKLNIEQARELEVKATERLLELFNTETKIRPYLAEYPFTVNRATVSIGTQTTADRWPTDGSVVHVFTAKNKIFYSAAELYTYTTTPFIDSETGIPADFVPEEVVKTRLVDLYEEPYEEALKIVNQKSNSTETKH